MPNTFSISRKTFNDLEDWIRDNEASVEKLRYGTDLIVRLIVLTTKGLAQAKTMGPVAPKKRSVPALAYKIPVQRITGKYYAGWTLKRLSWGAWMLFNDERAAYIVEFGIGMRVRRPILKMSIIGMLRFVQSTQTVERFGEWVIAPRRNARGQFQSFETRMRGSGLLSVSGPQGRLP